MVFGFLIMFIILGWVFVEGYGVDGVILDCNELELYSGCNVQVIYIVEQLVVEVLFVYEVVVVGDYWLCVIGVIWNVEVLVQVVLLVELLIGVGFDNVVLVWWLCVIEILVQVIVFVIGYE